MTAASSEPPGSTQSDPYYNPKTQYYKDFTFKDLSQKQINLIIATPFVFTFFLMLGLILFRRRKQKREALRRQVEAEIGLQRPIEMSANDRTTGAPHGWRDEALHGNPVHS